MKTLFLRLSLAFAGAMPFYPMAPASAESMQGSSSTVEPKRVTVGVETTTSADDIDCGKAGKKFHRIGGYRACGAILFDATIWGTKEFTSNDILLHGTRLLNPALVPAVPLLTYELKDYSNRTYYPNLNASARATYVALVPTSFGPIQAVGSVRFAGELVPTKSGGFETGIPNLFGSTSAALLDQAWVKFRGFHIGYAPSYFGFNRYGYSFLPAYLSSVNLPLLAYTYVHDDQMSLSVSIEDSARRAMADGILSSYGARHYFDGGKPELVALARYKYDPRTLFSVSAALHEIRDEIAGLCCGAPVRRQVGWAMSAGVEAAVDWSRVLGHMGSKFRGALIANIAAARGAMSYLGVPTLVTDYVASSTGSIKPSSGVAGVVGYRHFLSPRWEAAFTANVYKVASNSSPELELATNAPFGFEYRASGVKGTLGMTHKWSDQISVGGEVSYTWDRAQLKYTFGDGAAAHAAPLTVSFPSLTLFARMQW